MLDEKEHTSAVVRKKYRAPDVKWPPWLVRAGAGFIFCHEWVPGFMSYMGLNFSCEGGRGRTRQRFQQYTINRINASEPVM